MKGVTVLLWIWEYWYFEEIVDLCLKLVIGACYWILLLYLVTEACDWNCQWSLWLKLPLKPVTEAFSLKTLIETCYWRLLLKPETWTFGWKLQLSPVTWVCNGSLKLKLKAVSCSRKLYLKPLLKLLTDPRQLEPRNYQFPVMWGHNRTHTTVSFASNYRFW